MGAKIMVTADHGNAEVMLAADGSADTAHSTDRVPLVVLEDGTRLREGAGLSDMAPTVLCFLGLEAPSEMTGTALCWNVGILRIESGIAYTRLRRRVVTCW